MSEINNGSRISNLVELRRELAELNVVDIAAEIEEMEARDMVIAFRILPKDKAADVFAYLSADTQRHIIESIDEREIYAIINELYMDDTIDFIEEMPANVVRRVLANTTPERRKLINTLLQYPEDSAGSIMTVEYVTLKSDMTVSAAFSQIRATGTDKETIYTCYVIDNARKLIGQVTAKTLFLSGKNKLISEVMDPNVISARTHDDREGLTNKFRVYGFLAMPVVDNENRLVGIVTFDDALLVQEEEATEDFEKMAGVSPSEKPYLSTSVFALSRNRVPWLLLLNVSVFITGAVVQKYEDLLAVLPVLATFIPMLMDTSGDAGSQSSTLIIRGMAVGDIKSSDVLSVLWKESRVSLVCGGCLALVNFARVMIFNHGFGLALVSSIALMAATVMAKIMGAMLPLGARLIKIDPAVMAGPILTTIVDATSLMLYFSLCVMILRIH